MTVLFRNVDVDPTADPDDWPFETILTVVERGMVSDWRRLTAAIRASPWGPCARAVQQISSWGEHFGTDALFAERIRAVRLALGLSLRELAPMIGTSASRLSSYESGQVAPTVNILGRLDFVARHRDLDEPVWG